MADVSLKDVRKGFGTVEIIKGVSLDITHGEFIVFVGPSGCGKSTLLRLVAGLEEITSGSISIADKVVNDLPPKDRSIAMVFQSYALFPHMTVRDNVAFGLKIAGAPKAEMDEKVAEAARMLKLEPLLDRKPSQLSGGQRQRVAIGRAIVRRPDVFLFDEPLSNLDAALRVGTRAEIAKLHRDLDATMIYVTHDQIEAMTLADRIVVLEAGEVRQFGTPLQLYHTPNNKFVAGFIGSPKMNFLDAVVSATAKDSVTVTGANFKSVRAAVASVGIAKGDAVSIGIRPEHVSIASGKSAACNGKISLVEMLGHETYLEVEIGDGQNISALVEGDDAYTVGQPIGLAFSAEDCHLFKADGQAAARLVLPAIMAKDKLIKDRRKSE
jgi:multiple sugar transport system ATP-binding protein